MPITFGAHPRISIGFSLFDWVVGKLPAFITKWLPKLLLEKLKPLADEWQKTMEDKGNELLEPVWKPLKPVISVVTDLKEHTVGLFTRAEKLAKSIMDEYNAIKNFKEDLHWRGRVVNAPQVVKKIKRLTEIPREVLEKVQDMVKQIKEQLPEGAAEPAELAEDAGKALEGFEDFSAALAKFAPKLLKIGEKLLGVLAILVQSLIAWNQLVDDLQTIIDDVKEVRLDIEKLDLIFLPQNNKRKFVTLDDGRTMRLRIGGHTHPS